MNNNIMKFAIAGITCAVFCTAALAAPRGTRHGGNGRPNMAPNASFAARPAPKAPAARPAPRPAPRPPAARPAPRPAPRPPAARPAPRPPAHVNHARPHHPMPHLAHHHAPPPRFHHHRNHIPHGARYWARPPVPLWRVGALRAWEWIAAEWVIFENGVYYYGDGYYFDGYNYFYNGTYHLAPPATIMFM